MLLKFGKFLVYIWVVVLWLNFTTQMTLRHLLLMPMNKILDWKEHQICSKMLKKICIYVKRKSNISFRVIKNSSFDQRFLMVKTFLKILWWRFLVPHSEHLLVSSVTLSCVMQNILTLSMLVYYNANSFYSMFLSNNQGFKWNSFWGFIVFKLLLNFITSQYS